MKYLRNPNRRWNQPVIGMIDDVRHHVRRSRPQPIWSSGVAKLARMSVSATLTIEMSIIAISGGEHHDDRDGPASWGPRRIVPCIGTARLLV